MSYAVILVAWLAMMPQLLPKQKTDFFNWAMSTFLPAVTLVLEGVTQLPNSGLALPWCMPKGMNGMAGSQGVLTHPWQRCSCVPRARTAPGNNTGYLLQVLLRV